MHKNPNISPDEDRFWGKIPFPENELLGKTVEFKITVKWPDQEVPAITDGTGKFFIRQSKKGFHVQIISEIDPQNEKRIDLTEEMAKEIEREPEGSKFDFRLFIPPCQTHTSAHDKK
ncbi:MAG: hypothetical protein NTZ16_02910 [Verrucomicrobia bacterium]|nr:hypothetical protein [Verrucomicrobiota bacterium]